MAHFKVFLDHREVIDGETLPLALAQTKPQISFLKEPKIYYNSLEPKIYYNSLEPKTYYSIFMVDPDAPYPEDPKYKYWLHWIILNNNEEFASFIPPTPPQDSKKHRYYFFLFKQAYYLDIKKIPPITQRPSFHLSAFTTQNHMTQVAAIYFQTGHKL